MKDVSNYTQKLSHIVRILHACVLGIVVFCLYMLFNNTFLNYLEADLSKIEDDLGK